MMTSLYLTRCDESLLALSRAIGDIGESKPVPTYAELTQGDIDPDLGAYVP